MSQPPEILRELLIGLVDGQLDQDELWRLDEALRANLDVQYFYDSLITLHSMLLWRYAPPTLEVDVPGSHLSIENAASPVVAPQPAPILGFLGTAAHGTAAYLCSGWPLAYLIATVIFGIGLLVGSHIYVSQPVQVARQAAPLPSPLSPLPSIVGRITGMVDCRWEGKKGDSPPLCEAPEGPFRQRGTVPLFPLVTLGDKYVLTSGLMEITYNTGAKVILQGPVNYETESNGGYLALGKLTGKLETKAQDPRPKTPDPSSFAIRTPTATVTDLGTEFGVEVSKEGHTTSHVFRGTVRLQVMVTDGKAEGSAQVLHENESARVENRGSQGVNNRITMLGSSAKPANFVREIPKQTVKLFDLVDVVAGGDGFSGRRNAGIDPLTGRATTTPPKAAKSAEEFTVGDGKYHRVEELPFVDGVFIPDGRLGAVQVDSAGHTFAEFGETSNRTAHYVWAGGAYPGDGPYPVRTELDGVDYASSGHGLIFLHSNKGVTFDLAAIRRANPDDKILRFRAVAGNTETASEKGEPALADFWVLVDGQVRFRRREINGLNGAFSVVVPLDESDRFLTLAATDGGNGIYWDWIIFGDPRLEMRSVENGAKQ